MPYATRKMIRKPNCYKVYNTKTKQVYSKCTTKKNAIRQMRLLRAIEFNKDFVPRGSLASQKRRTRKRK